jgi:hypothetical protein
MLLVGVYHGKAVEVAAIETVQGGAGPVLAGGVPILSLVETGV